MQNRVITVVVPVYNMEFYLERCLSTLLNQTYPFYEILLIDDGSTDRSPLLCEDYEKNYPAKVRCLHKENGGLSSARNYGIDHARGSFIIFPDPDDWVDPDYLERFIELGHMYPDALCCTGHIVEFENGTKKSIPDNGIEILKQNKGILRLIQAPSIGGFAWNKLYNLAVIREKNLRFADDVGTKEDLEFAARYMKHVNQVVYAPTYATYHYFQRSGSATWTGYSQKRLAGLKAYERIIEMNKEDSSITDEARCCICNASLNLMILYLKDGIENKEQYQLLSGNIRKNCRVSMQSSSHGIKRKIAILIACINPKWINMLYK